MKLGLLKWKEYLGLPRQALYLIINVFIRERKTMTAYGKRGGSVSTEAETGVTWPQVKECQQSPKLQGARN